MGINCDDERLPGLPDELVTLPDTSLSLGGKVILYGTWTKLARIEAN